MINFLFFLKLNLNEHFFPQLTIISFFLLDFIYIFQN